MASDKNTKLDQGFEAGLRVKPYVHFDVDAEWVKFSEIAQIPETPPVIPMRKWSLYKVLSYAAVLFFLLAVLVFISKPVTFTETLITKNEKQTITLFDGTKIEIAENTILHYPVREKDIVVRRVVLEKGKATFNVAKNSLPFVVSSYPLEINVTGTVFTIEKTKTGVRVDHHEGKVEVTRKGQPKDKIVLTAKDVVKNQEGELFLSKNGAPFEQKTMFTFASVEKAQKLKAAEEEKQKLKAQSSTNTALVGSNYRMKDLIDFLDKKYKKELKIKKKKRLKSDETVMVDLNQSLEKILTGLSNKGLLKMESGKCAGCFNISPPDKPKKK